MKVAFAAMLIGLPGVLAAECPDPGDLSRGIVIDTLRGTEHFARGADGTVIVTVRPKDATFTETTEYARGIVPVVTTITADPGSDSAGYVSTLEFDRAALDALMPPEPGDRIALPAHYTRTEPPLAVDLGLEVEVRGAEAVGIGTCSYGAVQVEYRLARPEGTFRAIMNYLPDLGLAYVAARELPSGERDDDAATLIRLEGE